MGEGIKNMNEILDGYLAIVLTEESHRLLLGAFPPLHEKVYAHHVTVAYKPTATIYKEYEKDLGTPVSLTVYGYAHDEKGQAVVVRSDFLKGNKLHHITISTKGVAPVYSNVLLEDGFEEIAEPFVLNGTFEFVDYQKQ